jgi:archaeal type IV pilus assembly protein PilA
MNNRESAVSSVMGEILLIALVLILVPMVTISLLNQLPEDRVSTVTIMMKINLGSSGIPETVILYHKGGDYIKKDDISVIVRVRDSTGITRETPPYRKDTLEFSTASQVFDLGENVQTPKITIFGDLSPDSDISVSLIAKNTVIFNGEHHYEG